MKTSTPKPSAPQWVLIDAEGGSLGRIAANIASVLRGKHYPTFSRHMVCGDHVIVINVAKLLVHPAKLAHKMYYRHTGYVGHLRKESLQTAMKKNPAGVLERAVKGMLPRNRLRALLLKRLHVFAGSEHTHEAQKPVHLSNIKSSPKPEPVEISDTNLPSS